MDSKADMLLNAVYIRAFIFGYVKARNIPPSTVYVMCKNLINWVLKCSKNACTIKNVQGKRSFSSEYSWKQLN